MVAVGEKNAGHSKRDTELDHPPRIGFHQTMRTAELAKYRASTTINCKACIMRSPSIRVDTALGGREFGRHMAYFVCVV